jgi:hypothetical protein
MLLQALGGLLNVGQWARLDLAGGAGCGADCGCGLAGDAGPIDGISEPGFTTSGMLRAFTFEPARESRS